jgi:hypothetical protein
VSEAGGRVTSPDGSAFTSRGGQVLATNEHLHTAMIDVIAAFRRVSPGSSPQSKTH